LRHRSPVWSTRVAMAQPSQLEVRMKALLNSKLNHRPLAASRVLFAAVISVALLVPAAVVHATARNETADISGTVRSPGGALVVGANVTLVNLKTLKKLTTSTGEDGSFEFRSVPAGRYMAEIDKPGLTSTNIREFELKPSRNVLVVAYIGHSSEKERRRPPHGREHMPKRIRIGGEVEASKLIYHVSPEYPPLAKAAKIQGMVKLEAVIDEDGKVEDLKVQSGHPLLVKAALDAVRQWRYKLTYLNGIPAEVETTINVNFILAH
jgi:TonB family protein